MADTQDVDSATRALVAAVFRELRNHERAVRLRPSQWMDLMSFGGQTVMGLAGYQELHKALTAAFPDRFAGPLGTHELPEQYIWALLDGAVLRAANGRLEMELRPEDLSAAISEMLELLLRERDRAIAVRVLSDITVDAPFYAGGVELRPVGNWGLTDAYRDIDRFIPGALRLLDTDIGYRTGPSFTFGMLRTETDAPVGDRMREGYSVAKSLATGRIETMTAALRLATATTSQAVVDITSSPGHGRLYRPEIFRHDTDFMENIQRIAHIEPDQASAVAALADRLPTWGGDDQNPHSLGVALSRFGRSFVARPWFDMLVDVAVGLEAALLGGSEQEEISLRLRSRAAALLATSADPPAKIYDDVKRIYGLRSLVVHGSNPTMKELEALAYKISSTERTTWRGVKWSLALDRARDLLRRAILARGFLLDTERWPVGKKGRRFDVDAQLIDPGAREEWRQGWRGALESLGLVAAADEATPAALEVALADHSYQLGKPVPNGGSGGQSPTP